MHGSRGKVKTVELDLYCVAILVSHTHDVYVCQAMKCQCVIWEGGRGSGGESVILVISHSS